MVSTFAEIIRDLLIFVGLITSLLIVVLVVVANLPSANAFKHLLRLLAYRLGATAAAGMLAIPIEPIPGVDALFDLGAPVLLIWYWFTFFRDARRWTLKPQRQPHVLDRAGWRPGGKL